MEGGSTERGLGVDPPTATVPGPSAGEEAGAARAARLASEQSGWRDQEPPQRLLRTGSVKGPAPEGPGGAGKTLGELPRVGWGDIHPQAPRAYPFPTSPKNPHEAALSLRGPVRTGGTRV